MQRAWEESEKPFMKGPLPFTSKGHENESEKPFMKGPLPFTCKGHESESEKPFMKGPLPFTFFNTRFLNTASTSRLCYLASTGLEPSYLPTFAQLENCSVWYFLRCAWANSNRMAFPNTFSTMPFSCFYSRKERYSAFVTSSSQKLSFSVGCDSIEGLLTNCGQTIFISYIITITL
jgi:hypothetical protein